MTPRKCLISFDGSSGSSWPRVGHMFRPNVTLGIGQLTPNKKEHMLCPGKVFVHERAPVCPKQQIWSLLLFSLTTELTDNKFRALKTSNFICPVTSLEYSNPFQRTTVALTSWFNLKAIYCPSNQSPRWCSHGGWRTRSPGAVSHLSSGQTQI